MKRVVVFLLFAMTLIACNNEGLRGDNPFGDKYKFAKTNLSAIEVLCLADAWKGADFCFYTEPDGKGKKKYYDPSEYVGFSLPLWVFTFNTITSYGIYSSIPISYYVENPLEIVDDNMLLYDADHKDDIYIKILDYDEETVYIETNGYHSFSPDDDIEYGYARMYLKKREFTDEDKEKYRSKEELDQFLEELGYI